MYGYVHPLCGHHLGIHIPIQYSEDFHGYKLYLDSPTNQQFFIVENEKLKKWDAKIGYSFIEKYDSTHTVVRFATSWATKMDDVERLIENLE